MSRKVLLGLVRTGLERKEKEEDRTLFSNTVDMAIELDVVTEKKLMQKFLKSAQEVESWRSGINAPHPEFRPAVYEYILRMLFSPVRL